MGLGFLTVRQELNFSVAARLRDRSGEHEASLELADRELCLTSKGYTFSGPSFESLKPDDAGASQHGGFHLRDGDLNDVSIAWDHPIAPCWGKDRALGIEVMLGAMSPVQGRDIYRLEIRDGDKRYQALGEDLDHAFVTLHHEAGDALMPPCCGTCALGAYDPMGAPTFLGLFCFREVPEDHAGVRSSTGLLRLLQNESKRTLHTHELYHCGDWEMRSTWRGQIRIQE